LVAEPESAVNALEAEEEEERGKDEGQKDRNS
jgi:hypothetical protein